MFLYLITNTENDKQYVGITTVCIKARFRQHKIADTLIGRAIRKYGASKFKLELIGTFTNLEDLWTAEAREILSRECLKPKGYNSVPGGINPSQVPEIKDKIRQKAIGRVQVSGSKHPMFGTSLSEEHKKKMQDGVKKRAENRRRNGFKTIKEKKKERRESGEYARVRLESMEKAIRSSASARKGKKLPDSTCSKISEKLKGKPKSADHIAKVAVANTGKVHSEETKQKISKAKSLGPIKCTETSEMFNSAQHAAEQLGICKCSILRVISNKRKTAGGLTFELVKD